MTAFEDEPIVLSYNRQPENLEVFEIIPESIFDARVIAHFDAEISEIDPSIADILEPLMESPIFDVGTFEPRYRELVRKRSELYSQRAIYEIEIASLDTQVYNPREVHIPLYINNVTIYKDKLAVFRCALSHNNIDALATLGDLRKEAELSGDITNIALYALEEVRAGINIHENMDTIRVIAEHRSVNITEYYDIAPALINAVYLRLANGDVEGARHAYDLLDNVEELLDYYYSDLYRVKALMLIVEGGLTIKDITKRPPIGQNERSYRKLHYLTETNTKPEYESFFRLNKGGTNRDPLTLSMLDDQWDTYGNTKIEVLKMGSGMRALLELRAPITLRRAEIELINSLYNIQKKQIRGEEVSPKEQTYVSFDNIARVAIIARRYNLNDTDDKKFIELNTGLEFLIEEYAQVSSDKKLFSTVDNLRTQVVFNRKIESLFKRAKEISSPSTRFRFLEKLVRLQAIHDPSSDDSKLNEQIEELRRVGILCTENPYERVFVNKETVNEAIEKIDKLASENMQQ